MEIAPAYSFHIENIMAKHGDKFSEGFQAWLMANWSIYLEFESQAHKVINSGRKHYSARTIVEYIRHNTLLAETGGEFKINNNSVADLARLFGIRNPVAVDLFEYRVTNKHIKPFGKATP
jgi:hypothetical protein